jgi:hypothetical protein
VTEEKKNIIKSMTLKFEVIKTDLFWVLGVD